MAISVKSFRQLEKMMGLTTSDNDGEALNAIRGANRILKENSISWAAVFGRLVTVDVEAEPSSQQATTATSQSTTIDDAFKVLFSEDLRGGFEDFISSLHEQWQLKRWISPAQREALFNAVRRANDKAMGTSRR